MNRNSKAEKVRIKLVAKEREQQPPPGQASQAELGVAQMLSQISSADQPRRSKAPIGSERSDEGLCAGGELGPLSAIRLCVLGTALREPSIQEVLNETVQYLSWPSWEPSPALIDKVIYSLLAEGCLTPVQPLKGEPRFGPSERGLQQFHLLMLAQSAQILSPFGQACTRMKMAFIDLLGDLQRRAILDRTARRYEREMILRRNRFRPLGIGWLGQSWLAGEGEQQRRQLIGLRSSAFASGETDSALAAE